MTKAIITDNEIILKGHAGYDVPGKDIVCAGISLLAYMAADSLEKLAAEGKVNIEKCELNPGNAHIKWSGNFDGLNIIINGFNLISKNYPDYLEIGGYT